MAEASRRTFLKTLNLAMGSVLATVLAVPGIRFFIFPAKKRVVAGPTDFMPVATLQSVTSRPLRVEITAPALRDAWARVENVRLGAAWLVRDGAGGVRAFTATCPHLGCPVDFDERAGNFRCPCHTSSFSLAGERVSGPAKRGMDPLDSRVEPDGTVLVRFRRFKPDVAEREDA